MKSISAVIDEVLKDLEMLHNKVIYHLTEMSKPTQLEAWCTRIILQRYENVYFSKPSGASSIKRTSKLFRTILSKPFINMAELLTITCRGRLYVECEPQETLIYYKIKFTVIW